MDPLTFQAELEQLIEDMSRLSAAHYTPQLKTRLRRIGRKLLIGKEFLSAEEYHQILRQCAIAEEDAAFAIELCTESARAAWRMKELEEHADDLLWLMEQKTQLHKELEQEEE